MVLEGLLDGIIAPPVLHDVELVGLVLTPPVLLDDELVSLVLTVIGVVVPVEYTPGPLV